MSDSDVDIDKLLAEYAADRASKADGFRLSDEARAAILDLVRSGRSEKRSFTMDELLTEYANPPEPAPKLDDFSRNQILAEVRREDGKRESSPHRTLWWRLLLRPQVLVLTCLAVVIGGVFLHESGTVSRRFVLASVVERGTPSTTNGFRLPAEIEVSRNLRTIHIRAEGGANFMGTLVNGRLENVPPETMAVFDLKAEGFLRAGEPARLEGSLVWELTSVAGRLRDVVAAPGARLRFSGEIIRSDGRREAVEFQ